MSITELAPAKLNLTLDVGARRPDGYHEITSVMQSAALYDVVTIEVSKNNGIVVESPGTDLPTGPDNLLVDGYNVIFAWDELRKMADANLDAARRHLMDILCNYAGYKRCVPILVFDAYKVRGGTREVEKHHNLYVVYTKEAETADMYIERATHELAKDHRTRVVSSDGAEQIIVLGNGALRVSARAFAEEVAAVEKEIREFLQG